MHKKLNSNFRVRVEKYLRNNWNEEKNLMDEQIVKIIKELSTSLKNELLLEVNGPFLKNLPLFRNNFSEQTLLKCANIIKEQKYL